MEPLPDPKGDRVVKEIEPPPAQPISHELLYPNDGTAPDWRALKQHMQKEGRVSKEHCMDLIKRVSDITSAEPNLLRLSAPITVVGDIHGQYYDMIKLLDVGGNPEKTQYLFLGDYVDRGSFSIEVLCLLYALKLTRPQEVWLLRGNHECRQMTAFFNFRDECEYKYDLSVYYAFMESFDTLPLAAVIDNKFLCLHGGLSPDLDVLSQVAGINRFQEPPRAGLFCDLLWADPIDEEKSEHLAHQAEAFFPNDVRGCSFFFGYEAAIKFLHKNHLLSVIRAHEAQLEGFKMHQTNTQSGFPTVITIFSAPNYCDCYNNKGAVLKFENNTLNIQQLNFSPHPYHLPNFMDIFTWSIPFVSEKVTEMLYAILNPSIEEYEEEEDESLEEIELPEEVKRFMMQQPPSAATGGAQEPEAPPASSATEEPMGGAADPGSTTIHNNSNTTSRRQGGTSAATSSSSAAAPAPQSTGTTRSSQISKERAEALRRKVQSVARLMRVFRTLREQHELIVQLKGVTPGHRIPPGALLKGEEGLKDELEKFQKAKQLDLLNERRPPPEG